MENANLDQVIAFDLTNNTNVVTVDGLFAGFSFAGVLQIFNLQSFPDGSLDYLLLLAIVILIMSTVLFALRINIAMRMISCCNSAQDRTLLVQSRNYIKLRSLGTKVELLGIIMFWTSLVPITFHFKMWLGYVTIAILIIAFSAYFCVVRTWKKINQNVPQITIPK